ncbi:MAG: efflux RND transporter periplasmic adaptor subunit [Peptoclostridium sp.]|uniref:efflux RND transporter periplasmic adaptor subunit n=1 Tax=Peptoclostridium sp. TaxID=1904860 RepID=UPI00139D48F6|nr:efflux RND transporter periplasmic adaptor subunit [Peptoclostridium sp.]MZQ76356.1 efflux RND transporter periplasmic adaptor subunit [Peptoclostridium sp.]
MNEQFDKLMKRIKLGRKGVVVMLAFIAVASVVTLMKFGGEGKDNTESETFTKDFAVETGDIKDSFTSDGCVELSTYDISFERAGIVEKLNVKEGDYIEAGTLIASLTDDEYESSVINQENNLRQARLSASKNAQTRAQNIESLESQLQSAKNTLSNAKSEYELVSTLPDTYSQNEIEQKRQALEKAQSDYNLALSSYKQNSSSIDSQLDSLSVEKAQESLKQARDDLKKSTMYSPVSGTIVEIAFKEGERVSEETTFIRIASEKGLKVTTDVSELDVTKVKVGMNAQITFSSIDGKTYEGTVEYIDAIATTTNSGSVTYPVTILLDTDDPMIKDSMSCTVEFVSNQKENVLVVPKKALAKSNESGSYSVIVVSDSGEKQQQVDVGLMDSLNAEIISGLEQGDKVKVKITLEDSNQDKMMMGPGMGGGAPPAGAGGPPQ